METGKLVYYKATGWHFEMRDARNETYPTIDEVRKSDNSWELLPREQALLHDNKRGKPELKYIHPDGREAVFDGDTLEPGTDPRYKGTYNYVFPEPLPEPWYDHSSEEWILFDIKGAGHTVLDVAPYIAGGNVRGDDTKPPE